MSKKMYRLGLAVPSSDSLLEAISELNEDQAGSFNFRQKARKTIYIQLQTNVYPTSHLFLY